MLALGTETAATLSLHSGRVWLACALLSLKYDDPTIQAMCRWQSPASVRVYARMQAADYARLLTEATGATIDPSLTRSLPTLDDDAAVIRLHSDMQAAIARTTRAASPCAPRATSPAATRPAAESERAADDSDADDNDNDDDDDIPVVAAGPPITPDVVRVGLAVAVPFRVDGHETHCPGEVTAVNATRAKVKFDDGSWDVDLSRLFEIANVG